MPLGEVAARGQDMGKQQARTAAIVALVALVGFATTRSIPALQMADEHRTSAFTMAVPAGAIRVDGSQPLVRQPPLRLSGRVLGLRSVPAGLRIDVQVGASSYAANVVGDTYTVDLGLPDPSAMITVHARASALHFSSIVGTVAQARAFAGDDLHADAQEISSLNVSAFRTALSWLVRHALGGRDPLDDRQLRDGLRAAVTPDLAVMTHVIDQLAHEPERLPSSYPDGFALVRDRAAYTSFAEASWEVAPAHLAQIPDSAPLSSLQQLPEKLLMIDGMPYRSVAPAAGNVHLLARKPDGSFDLYENTPLRAPNYSVRLDAGGGLELTPRHEIQRSLKGSGGIIGLAGAHRLVRLASGHGVDIWLLEAHWEEFYAGTPRGERIEYRVFAASSLPGWSHLEGWPQLTGGNRALPWFCEQPLQGGGFYFDECDYVLHQLQATGSNSTIGHGTNVNEVTLQPAPATGSQPFSWSLDWDRSLRVDTANAEVQLWRLDSHVPSVANIVYLARSKSAATADKMLLGLSVDAVQNQPQATSVDVLGEWQSEQPQGGWPRNVGWMTLYGAMEVTARKVRRADGTGNDQIVSDVIRDTPLFWEVRGNAFYDTWALARLPDRSQRYFRSCADAAAANADMCSTIVGYYRPVTRTARGFFGIREIYQTAYQDPRNGAPSAPLKRVWFRPGYQSCTGGACVASFGPAASAMGQNALQAPPDAQLAGIETARRSPTIRPVHVRIPRLMPIYAFECTQCGHSFDRLQKLSDPDPDTCPACSAHAVKRQLTAPSFRLAGSGWYETDFKKDGDKKRNLADGGEGAKPSGDSKPSTESAPAAKSEPSKTDAKPSAAKPAAE